MEKNYMPDTTIELAQFPGDRIRMSVEEGMGYFEVSEVGGDTATVNIGSVEEADRMVEALTEMRAALSAAKGSK